MMINVHKPSNVIPVVSKHSTPTKATQADKFYPSAAAPDLSLSARHIRQAAAEQIRFTKEGYTEHELQVEFNRLSSNPQGRFGALDTSGQSPVYFQTILDSLKPGETLPAPVSTMLDLVNSFMFSQDQVVPAYQAISKYAANPDDRLKLSEKFMQTFKEVKKHSSNPGMAYDSRPKQAVKQFEQEMSSGHQYTGYSAAELKRESDRLGGNYQGRYGTLSKAMQTAYFKTIEASLKPGEPLSGAVDSMLSLVNRLMFTQDQVIPTYDLIDQYASSPQERLKLTDKFLQTLDSISAPSPGMHYDTRPGLAQAQFKKELEA